MKVVNNHNSAYLLESCRMPCGHIFNKQQLKQHLNGIITRGEHIIKCPFLENGKICNAKWDYSKDIQIYLQKSEQIYYGSKFNNLNSPSCYFIGSNINPNNITQDPLIMFEQISIEIQSMTGVTKSIDITTDMTGLVIKYYVANLFPKLLTPQKMDLFLNEIQISDNQQIKHILNRSKKPFLLIQKRLSLQNMPELKTKYDQFDDQYAAQMPCGHYISQSSLLALIYHTISKQKYKIICPQINCNKEWDYQFCKKIAVLTQQQQQKFNQNLFKFVPQKLKCPYCGAPIYKDDSTNRVKCPYCKGPDYCYCCLKTWKTSNYQICGNDDCNKLSVQECAQILHMGTEDRVLDLYINSQKTKSQKIKVPTFRACPKCAQILNYKDESKTCKCPKCKISFCWICLSIRTEDGKWPCKGAFDFCGKIAPIQDYAELLKEIKIK